MLQGQGNKSDKGQTRYKVGLQAHQGKDNKKEKLLGGLKLVVEVAWYMHRDLLPLSAPLTHLVGRNGIS